MTDRRPTGRDGDRPLPANFRFVRVRSVVPVGRAFLRVTFEGNDLSNHGDRAIHFRLVLPPPGTAEPVWPTVGATGGIAWPEGSAAPHRPVYSARRVDHADHTLDMDVFLHDGGRTTAWAQALQRDEPGARRRVGIVGPAGGGLLQTDRALIASDETGFPAAARLLENLPPSATGTVLLESEHGAACAYPIDTPAGFSTKWLHRARGERLDEATIAALPEHDDATVWFAGERQQATRVREAALGRGREKTDLRISGFWRAAPKDER
ncbi:MAG: siderophore-interacting protein [Myxococcota bacterium]